MKNETTTVKNETTVPNGWFILYNNGLILPSFEGDKAAAEAECYRLNRRGPGWVRVLCGFATREECDASLDRLNEFYARRLEN